MNVENNKTPQYAIKMNNIYKTFLNGKIKANTNITLNVRENEIHTIIGENGAGKSTLMSILFGLYTPDSGEILINDKRVFFNSAMDANKAGLGMVHQHFKLVQNYTVFENIILGVEDTNGVFLETKDSKKRIKALIDEYNFNLNINSKISSLSVGQQQKTEILKLLYRNANILIFDEPTAVLSDDEIEQFLKMLSNFKKQGKTIIIITHKFNEIKKIADNATVIRHGKLIDTFVVKDKTVDEMASLMVGKKIVEVKNNSDIELGEVILDVKNLTVSSSTKVFSSIPDVKKIRSLINKKARLRQIDNNRTHINELNSIDNEINTIKKRLFNLLEKKLDILKEKNKIKTSYSMDLKIDKKINEISNFKKEFQSNGHTIDFKIREGEVFAIAGVEGNGQTELALILNGFIKDKTSVIKFLDTDITNASIKKRLNLGISNVPEDRHKHGLILDMPIKTNIVINKIDEEPFSKKGFINELSIDEYAKKIIQKYDIRGTTRGTAPSRLLSGGNQQKLIIGREISNEHKLIIMVQPTRGLDLGAIEYVHYQIMREKEKGNAVLLISYELDEILALADKIAVIHNGHFIEIGNKDIMTKAHIGELFAGKEL
jgi:simple sugar transport system ATP-binding protein